MLFSGDRVSRLCWMRKFWERMEVVLTQPCERTLCPWTVRLKRVTRARRAVCARRGICRLASPAVPRSGAGLQGAEGRRGLEPNALPAS